ncbi:MAG: acyl carrier protein [Clostridia bacterium]|nr:acyl carrier protein [Clostridia bacterium]
MKEKIIEILADAAGMKAEDITPEMDFAKDLGINSVEFADVAFSCEEEFDIEINEKDFRKIRTVADLMNYIDKLGA